MTRCLVLLALVFNFISSGYSQGKNEFKLNKEDIFKIPEVGAYIIKDKNNYKVQFVAPESVRLPDYKNVDLKKDDIIMIMNGKTIKKASDMNDIYEKLKPGNNIKLDVKRSGKMISVNLKKADPKDLPQRKIFKKADIKMIDKVFLHGYGVQIGKVNEKPMIEKINGDNDLVKKAGLKGGDVVTNINGQAIKTFSQFKSAFDSIGPGKEVIIRFSNKSISFKKADD